MPCYAFENHVPVVDPSSWIHPTAVLIGAESLDGATAFVKSEFECPPRSLLVGSPARVLRTLEDHEVAWKTRATLEYQALAARSLKSVREASPLSEVEPDRPRFEPGSLIPKTEVDAALAGRE